MTRAKKRTITVIIIAIAIAIFAFLTIGQTKAAANVAYADEQPTAPVVESIESTEAVVEETEGSETEATEETVVEETEEPETTEPATEATEPATEPATQPTQPSTQPTTPKHTCNFTAKVTKAATCTETGVETYTCSCGESYTKEIATVDHEYTKTVVAATCTTDGYTVNTCSCGHSFKDAETKATGHDYVVKTVAPTYEAEGYDIHTCKSCGNTFQDNWTDKLVKEEEPAPTEPAPTEPVAPHTHNYATKVIRATTCTENGITEYSCECGHSYQVEEEAFGHAYVNGVCQRCGEKNPDFQAPTEAECRNCDGSHEHIEVVVGDYTYVYCEHIEGTPFRSADGWVIYYPIRFYF